VAAPRPYRGGAWVLTLLPFMMGIDNLFDGPLGRLGVKAVQLGHPGIAQVELAKEGLQLQQQKVAECEAQLIESVRRWESLCEERARIKQQLGNGQTMFGAAQYEVENAAPTIIQWVYPDCHPNQRFQSFEGGLVLAARFLAAKFLLEHYEVFQKTWRDKLKSVETQLIEMAEKHGIEAQLPEDLRPAASASSSNPLPEEGKDL
jgi:hypothetical protein